MKTRHVNYIQWSRLIWKGWAVRSNLRLASDLLFFLVYGNKLEKPDTRDKEKANVVEGAVKGVFKRIWRLSLKGINMNLYLLLTPNLSITLNLILRGTSPPPTHTHPVQGMRASFQNACQQDQLEKRAGGTLDSGLELKGAKNIDPCCLAFDKFPNMSLCTPLLHTSVTHSVFF